MWGLKLQQTAPPWPTCCVGGGSEKTYIHTFQLPFFYAPESLFFTHLILLSVLGFCSKLPSSGKEETKVICSPFRRTSFPRVCLFSALRTPFISDVLIYCFRNGLKKCVCVVPPEFSEKRLGFGHLLGVLEVLVTERFWKVKRC